ncbi:MAG: SCO family protein [Verrucomicrobia bacterium]|nr:SCO family protein [Verrucomicrobiota bacterium]
MQHSSPPQRLEWLVWATIGLAVGLVLGAYGYSRLGSAGSGREEPPLPVLARVTGFDLTNHLGQAISAADLRGQPWLAGIIFTRCPGPCVRLTRNLVALQGQVPATTGLRFLLLTADPQYDVPVVLRQYGERGAPIPAGGSS